MADLTTIRTALAAQITTYTGLRAEAQVKDQISPPMALVMPGPTLVSYGDTMDGAMTIGLAVLLLISDAAPTEKVQRALDAYLGIGSGETQSIAGAIMEDPSLGRAVNGASPFPSHPTAGSNMRPKTTSGPGSISTSAPSDKPRYHSRGRYLRPDQERGTRCRSQVNTGASRRNGPRP